MKMIFSCVERQKSQKAALVLLHPERWKKVLERLQLLMAKYILVTKLYYIANRI